MGGSASRPFVPQPPPPPPPPPDPQAVCTEFKVTANSLQNQLNVVNKAVDSCDPSVKTARESSNLVATNQKFVSDNRAISDALSTTLDEKYRMALEMMESVKLLKQYEKELKHDNEEIIKKFAKLEHDERMYRRDFLDSAPTEGVPWHIFGFQTSDDKVMLTFWICALISFTLLAYIAVTTIMPTALPTSQYRTVVIIVFAALFISYLLITYKG